MIRFVVSDVGRGNDTVTSAEFYCLKMTSAVIPKRKRLFSVVAAVLFHPLTIFFFFFLEASILKRGASGYEPPGYCQLVFVERRRINMNKRVFPRHPGRPLRGTVAVAAVGVGVVVDRSVRSANRAASRWPTSAKDRLPGGQEVDVPELKLQNWI